jgi:hypothetical protein
VGTSLVKRAAAPLIAAILGLMLLPSVAAGASITFGTPTAQSVFGQGIEFTQPYGGSGIANAWIVISFPGDAGPSVASLDSIGSARLTFDLDGGALSPFQPVTASFRLALNDGTIETGPQVKVVYADDRYTWQSRTSGILTMHWIDGSASFGSQLLSYGTQGIAKAASWFGVSETDPIDFYIYPDQKSFASAMNSAETIGGVAESGYRTCFGLAGTSDLSYASSMVPHEVTHIVFSDATGNAYHSPPRWVNEGLATYLSEGYDSSNKRLVTQAVGDGTLVPLAALAGYFALDASRIYLSYAEAAAATDYMVRTYGQSSILKLVKAYGQGSSDDEAFTAAFGVTISAFDAAWLASNRVTAGQTYGPQPAPTGAVPPGWNGSSPTAPPVTPSTVPSSGATSSGEGPNNRDSDVLLLAGLVAAIGLLLLGIAWFLHVEGQRQSRL